MQKYTIKAVLKYPILEILIESFAAVQDPRNNHITTYICPKHILIHSVKKTRSFSYVSFGFGVLQEHCRPQFSDFSHILNDYFSYFYHFQTDS